jgi:drug/metabolite transporter (DMT)-like permease
VFIAIVAAVAAGVSFAVGGVVQQRVARTRPEGALSPGLLLSLARVPLWWAGIGFALLSYGLQSLALAFGPLVLVQPLLVTEVIFAIPISVRIHGMHLELREWIGVSCVVAGLALGIVSARPTSGNPLPALVLWGLAVAASGFVILGALGAARPAEGPVRASFMAAAAAVALALTSALLKSMVAVFQHHGLGALAVWQPYAMAVVAIGGLYLVQSAFRSGPLAASMPVIDGVEPSFAIGLGIALFGERVQSGVWPFLGIAVGLALLFAGIVLLDTSPVIQRLHERE